MLVLHALATWHTCEHNVEEEWCQINTKQKAHIRTHAGKLAYFDSYFNNVTVSTLKFSNLPVTRG